MSRPAAQGLLAVTLLALITVWFLTTYERVDVEVRIQPSAEAQHNPFLAAQRFVTRMGRASRNFAGTPGVQSPPPDAALLMPRGSSSLSPPRAKALLEWVAAGGHLILDPSPEPGRDAILAALHVKVERSQHNGRLDPFEVSLPGAPTPMRVAPSSNLVLVPGQVRFEVAVNDAAGTRMLHLHHGAGRVTLLIGMQRFNNRRIGDEDHAALLWGLLRLAPTTGAAMWVQAPAAPPLWPWLVEHATDVMLALAGLLALWLWRVLPRFGALRPPPQPGSRALVHHLTAAGRFRWANGGRASLLAAAREVCRLRVATAQPRIAHLPTGERNRELAALVGLAPVQIANAFAAEPRTAHEFVATVNVLASIHAALRHPGRAPHPRRKAPR